MRRLKRFVQIPGAERRLLICALFVAGIARVSLRVLSLEKSHRVVARVAAVGSGGDSVEQLMWAVSAASRFLAGTTCLAQAIAGQALLNHSGFSSQVEIGVAKDEAEQGLRAHAWVVCRGQVVLGEQPGARYNSLMVWDQLGQRQCR